MKNFLIFDMDGVLLDTMPLWEHLGVDYLTAHGIQPTPGLRERLLTMTLPQAAELFRSDFGMTSSAAEIIAGIVALAEEFYTVRAPLKPGVAETLTDNDASKGLLEKIGYQKHSEGIMILGDRSAAAVSVYTYPGGDDDIFA